MVIRVLLRNFGKIKLNRAVWINLVDGLAITWIVESTCISSLSLGSLMTIEPSRWQSRWLLLNIGILVRNSIPTLRIRRMSSRIHLAIRVIILGRLLIDLRKLVVVVVLFIILIISIRRRIMCFRIVVRSSKTVAAVFGIVDFWNKHLVYLNRFLAILRGRRNTTWRISNTHRIIFRLVRIRLKRLIQLITSILRLPQCDIFWLPLCLAY